MLVIFGSVFLPGFILVGLVLRWLMPRSSLFAKPSRPFRPNLWHLMVLVAAVAADYALLNPDLSSRATKYNRGFFLMDMTLLVILPFLGRHRRLSSIGWMVVACLLSLSIAIPAFIYRLLVPPH